jgi:D-3-phosphoglycerate dehydrogenase / 2-oxoglutarate reductase
VYRILVTDEVDEDGVALLGQEPSFQVDVVPTLPPAELLERIDAYDALIGRSATRITAELLQRGKRLRVIGRAGVGVDNIDMDAATRLGIAVINAPAGNTIAVAELFFGNVLSLLRHLPQAIVSMREGRWDRSQLTGEELYGKSLGIIGLGRIGGEIARRAHAFEMNVAAYDPYIGDDRFNALGVRRAASLEALGDADIITVHTPLTDETRGLIGRRELASWRRGVIVVNMARGGIVDDDALAAALESRQVGGAVLDVFAAEPLSPDSPLRRLPNTVLTPHLGASTTAGQRNVSVDACSAVRDALLHGELSKSLNVVGGVGTDWNELRPALMLARRAATIARALLHDQGAQAFQRISLRCGTDHAGAAGLLLASAAAGVVENTVDSDRLNLINARAIADARGMELTTSVSPKADPASISISVSGGMKEVAVAGIAPRHGSPRIRRIGGFEIDVSPRQCLIIISNRDVPGVIGRVGTLLGHAGVNIAEYHQSRLVQGGEALAAIAVDGSAPDSVRDRLLELPEVHSATIVSFNER